MPERASEPGDVARRGRDAGAEPSVTAVVLSYNYGRFLYDRLASIFEQEDPVDEVIVLDDASDDVSVEVARATAARFGREIELVLAARNSGNVFHQWRRAVDLARGDLVWIAEADDVADRAFTKTLKPLLAREAATGFAFCESRAIGVDGSTISPDYQAYYAELGPSPLAQDRVFAADDLLRACLSHVNMLVNVSAILWRRDLLRGVFGRASSTIESFTYAGDWCTYVEACRSTERVGYVATPLNAHREHRLSVSGRLDRGNQVAETERMHALLRQHLGDDPDSLDRMARHLAGLRQGSTRSVGLVPTAAGVDGKTSDRIDLPDT